MPAQLPIFYSFRRCPYAMRARLAIASSGIKTELREIVLREKPPSFLETSPSATVPCLKTDSGVIDESLDIMKWSLEQQDPENWLAMPQEGWDWITTCDGPFKASLDRTKYVTRYPDVDENRERQRANDFLRALNHRIDTWIFDQPTVADYAIFPFVRQFANIDLAKFQACEFTDLSAWLNRLVNSERFLGIMEKHRPWQENTRGPLFPSN